MNFLRHRNISRGYSALSHVRRIGACAVTSQPVSIRTKPYPNESSFPEIYEIQTALPFVTRKKISQEISSSEICEQNYRVTKRSNGLSHDISKRVPIVDTRDLMVEAHSCSESLKFRLSPLFPTKNLENVDMGAITWSHRTTSNVFDWDENMAAERERFANSFVSTAMKVCDSIRDLGFWADFINPFTCKPYFGEPTEASLTDTDDILRDFDFSIEDLTCVKLLRHHRWGYQFVLGVVFTDAPTNHPLLRQFYE